MQNLIAKHEQELAGLNITYARTVRARKRLEQDEAELERRIGELEAMLGAARQALAQSAAPKPPEQPGAPTGEPAP